MLLLCATGVLGFSTTAAHADQASRYLDPSKTADVTLPGNAAADKASLKARLPQAVKRLWGDLALLADLQERSGAAESAKFAKNKGLAMAGDRVVVIVKPVKGTKPDAAAALLAQEGSGIVRVSETHIKAEVPITSLTRLANRGDRIDHIRTPLKPRSSILSEGAAKMNADAWSPCGWTGTGAKVAVIDGGFIGLTGAITAGELPGTVIQRDETASGMETDSEHGTAVAEIIYDLAPDAELHLVKIDDESDLESAKNYCVTNGIHIVNHSMGWYGFNFFDGVAYSSMTPSPVAIVNDANSHGILWANSAGNDRQAHWRGTWADSDSDNVLEFTSGVEVNQIGWQNAGAPVVLQLTWNDWPTSSNDYDMHLVRSAGSNWLIAASSEYSQTGSQPPTETIGLYAPVSAYYGVIISRYSASGSETFILRSWYQNLQYVTASGSVGCPADAAAALAVGAIDEDFYTTGPVESFSSLGPNNGSYTGNPTLTKPDVCGPDATASWTYGTFYGTSASSPHIAGIAALVYERFPAYTNTQIRSYLETETIDLGSVGKDNTYGSGPVILPDPPDDDSDGTPDCLDNCPSDPDKTDPGQCGCGNPDTDTDGDGAADCNDPCPLDNPDDTDGDGVCDSDDGCPADPNKTDPGQCGCGNPDTDTDGDGVADCIDPCPLDNPDDTDGDGICDSSDLCIGNDATGDCDGDGTCDDLDPCAKPVLNGAVSRKTHTGAGDWDIDVGSGDIESRSAQVGTANPNEIKIIVVFDIDVDLLGNPDDVTADNGVVSAVSKTGPATLEIDVTGLAGCCSDPATSTFNTHVNLAFGGVVNAITPSDPAYTSDSTLCVRIIVGDYDNLGRTNFLDFAMVKNAGYLNQLVDSVDKARADFDCGGRANFMDFAKVKTSGLINDTAPACPGPPIGPP